MLLDRSDTGAVGLDAAGDVDLARPVARLDAERDGGQGHDDAFDQRRTAAAESLDAAPHDEPADRLADLDADGAVAVGDDAIELRQIDGSGPPEQMIADYGSGEAWQRAMTYEWMARVAATSRMGRPYCEKGKRV